jgi:hypothetical protein
MNHFKNMRLGATCALVLGLGAWTVGCADDEVLPGVGADAGSDAAADAAEVATDSGADTTVQDAGDAADASDATDSASPGDAADASDAPKTDGGTAADCLPTTEFAAIFQLQDATKCVVGQYTVAGTGLNGLTWGRHGGPLGLDGTTAASPSIVRYQVPATATGTITAAKQALTIPSLPATMYWGSQAVDMPFFGWTAIAYTGNGAGFPGELVLVDGSANLTRYNVNGLFSMNAVGLSGGRMLYTGLSTIGTTASTTNVGALYAADACGTASVTPRLVPGSDATCKAPQQIAAWKSGTSGPVTKDVNENVFAVLETFGAEEEIRGFERSAIAHNAVGTAGNTVATITGGGTEMAADGKTVFFQPTDNATYAALDVVAVDYTVDSTAKKVTAAAQRSFLKLVTAGTGVSLVADGVGRLWVVVAKPGAGATESWVFVLRDRMP